MTLKLPGIKNLLFKNSADSNLGIGSKSPEEITHLCKIYKAAAQTINHNTTTWLQFDTEEFDYNNMHHKTINNTRIIIKTPGIYQINGRFGIHLPASPATMFMTLTIVKNGAVTLDDQLLQFTGLNGGKIFCSTFAVLEEGDYLELNAFQWNVDSLNGETDEEIWHTRFEALRISN